MSTTNVPPGTCLIHGSFVGSACPVCSTAGSLPQRRWNQPPTPSPEQPEHEEARVSSTPEERRLSATHLEAIQYAWVELIGVVEPQLQAAQEDIRFLFALLASKEAQLLKAEQERDEAQKAWAAETKRATENGRLAQTQYDRAEAAERELERLREELKSIAGDGKNYAPCLPGCVEGPPTCGCAETRAERALSADTQREDGDA